MASGSVRRARQRLGVSDAPLAADPPRLSDGKAEEGQEEGQERSNSEEGPRVHPAARRAVRVGDRAAAPRRRRACRGACRGSAAGWRCARRKPPGRASRRGRMRAWTSGRAERSPQRGAGEGEWRAVRVGAGIGIGGGRLFAGTRRSLSRRRRRGGVRGGARRRASKSAGGPAAAPERARRFGIGLGIGIGGRRDTAPASPPAGAGDVARHAPGSKRRKT